MEQTEPQPRQRAGPQLLDDLFGSAEAHRGCPGGTLVLVVGLVGLALLELVARDARAHDVDLVTAFDLLAHPAPHTVDPVGLIGEGYDVGLDGCAPCR